MFAGICVLLWIQATINSSGLALANALGLPVMVVLLWWQVRSWRLLLIPIVTSMSAYVIAMGICNVIVMSMLVPVYQPTLVFFLCASLSISYALPIATRFQEERQQGASFGAALELTLTHAGRSTVWSGTIMTLAWLSLCAFPVVGLNAVGICM